jgi:hypothetical protein
MNNFEYIPPKNSPVSDESLLKDLRAVADKVGKRVSQRAYVAGGGKYNPSTILRRFGTWGNALVKVGLIPGNINNYSDEELFENILNIWRHNGKQPVRRDLDLEPSTISQSPYNRRFKSWSDTLRNFVAYASEAETPAIDNCGVKGNTKRISRDPSLRLRFQVLKRDHFACVQCGASPAKDQNVELHVDHIKPWSKGGETTILNLQTLCQKCNSGKSNIE